MSTRDASASLPPELASIAGVAHVEWLLGAEASTDVPPSLLVEVPHGADERAHYDALRARLVGDLPEDLHVFFHVNTDIGAWQYGRAVAERVLAAFPKRSALLVRCAIPRTFIDANRLEDAGDSLASGGMTAGLAPYVDHPDDRALLVGLHRAYVRCIEKAYAWVCDAGGFALSPHTYGPYVLPIERIDRSIVAALRAAHAPEVRATLAVRPEVDLLTIDGAGTRHAAEGLVESLVAGFAAMGLQAVEGGAYTLHPATQSYRFVMRYPTQTLCLEVRRDLLVEAYEPLDAMTVRADAVERVAGPIADALERWFAAR